MEHRKTGLVSLADCVYALHQDDPVRLASSQIPLYPLLNHEHSHTSSTLAVSRLAQFVPRVFALNYTSMATTTPDGEGNRYIGDSDIDSDSGDDVDFDNHIDMIFDDDSDI